MIRTPDDHSDLKDTCDAGKDDVHETLLSFKASHAQNAEKVNAPQ